MSDTTTTEHAPAHHLWSRARAAASDDDRKVLEAVQQVEAHSECEALDRGRDQPPLLVRVTSLTLRAPWATLAAVRAAALRALTAAGQGNVSVMALPVVDGRTPVATPA